ncbi:phage tail sheath C-terminal domain-containing protein [Methylomicrobium sp. Wu6]|uniref:phage tail sheath family protein n=1 Tax=Methylomicrobium sp. Wu6 TaxID=3107928 RepID=UPI002DD657FE|nr:phage tail sheath C-terminal domain-containing protein [Methylomicrobium sp. Wu6]MEC4748966.1 phage tail sheath subtilisin-like domain-containing protein [Methylomicrobium sp. Wu6]
MPVSPTYPGVYIEEIPSGVRTITGVATSITAFIGRAKRGPVNKATVINSYADYERIFGGLDLNSAMSYAVRDFYLNGGGQAIIGRLFQINVGEEPLAVVTVGTLLLAAANEGSWGNKLRVRVDHNVSADVAAAQGLTVNDLFNITIRDTGTGATETYLNVSVANGPRRIDSVLENQSRLVRVQGALPMARPAPSADPMPGQDPFGINVPATNYPATTNAIDSQALAIASYTGAGLSDAKQGLYLLKQADLFNLLCLPVEGTANYPAGLLSAATALCEQCRALLLVDPDSTWTNKDAARDGVSTYIGTRSRNAALFFPRLQQPNPLRDNQIEEFVPCGAVAGVFARTDATRGVWKAPAGIEATLNGLSGLSVNLNDAENGELNPLGINCLRNFPVIGKIVWGSRTLRGADILADEWKYVPVRRLALYIEESLFRGTQWVVFEPNDEPLWAQIRLNVGAFMNTLFRQGAFQGTTARQAYFVKCDSETTTQNDIDRGIVNIVVGFAPLKPAEFVIIKLQQIAGELQV